MYVAAARPDLTAETLGPSVIPGLFMLALIPPSYFFLGDLRLSPMRVLLLVTFLPLLFRLLSGAAGRLRAMDVLMMLFMAWIVVTLVYNHGLARFPYAMITMVELFGGYLIGRVLIRSEADFLRLFRYAFWVMVFLFPFVVVELVGMRNLLQELSQRVLPTLQQDGGKYIRLGLLRVTAGFEHPILYGLFCSTTLATLFIMNRDHPFGRLFILGFVGFMTFAALSSAPLLALAIQLGLLAWGHITANRWKLLLGLVVTAYVTVDLLSNRTPITILINYITFESQTAWIRIIIWEFGSAEMWRHPFFGIGLNDWLRPVWLPPSVDNFWLVIGMRHGALGLAFLILAIVAGLWSVLNAKSLSDDARQLRKGYVITLVALFFTLTTVHVWGGTSSLVMLLLGAGHWFRDAVAEAGQPENLPPARAGTIFASGPRALALGGEVYSRFPRRQGRPTIAQNASSVVAAVVTKP